jgi:hypothetical protein
MCAYRSFLQAAFFSTLYAADRVHFLPWWLISIGFQVVHILKAKLLLDLD